MPMFPDVEPRRKTPKACPSCAIAVAFPPHPLWDAEVDASVLRKTMAPAQIATQPAA